MKRIYIVLLAVIAGSIGCRQRYDPKVKDIEKSFLVVEANLSPGPDSTTIKLTKTGKLSDNNSIKPQLGAIVTVEGKDNSTRSMADIGNGQYYSANLGLIPGTEYRLRIKADGKEYLSDYVKAKITPPIDSIGLVKNGDGALIYVNTSDPADATRYYRWDFDETWEIHSYFFSTIVYEHSHIRPRLPDEQIYQCWKYGASNKILLANSVRLQHDVIYQAPVTLIPYGDDRLSARYSILLRQYAMDKGAYDFYEVLKKNTEEIGSLFTPQPSEITGNIHCITDPSVYVLGYVTASTVQQKRVFFTNIPWDFRQTCELIEKPKTREFIVQYLEGGYIGIDTFDTPAPIFHAGVPECVDCRSRQGSTVRPSYW